MRGRGSGRSFSAPPPPPPRVSRARGALFLYIFLFLYWPLQGNPLQRQGGLRSDDNVAIAILRTKNIYEWRVPGPQLTYEVRAGGGRVFSGRCLSPAQFFFCQLGSLASNSPPDVKNRNLGRVTSTRLKIARESVQDM